MSSLVDRPLLGKIVFPIISSWNLICRSKRKTRENAKFCVFVIFAPSISCLRPRPSSSAWSTGGTADNELGIQSQMPVIVLPWLRNAQLFVDGALVHGRRHLATVQYTRHGTCISCHFAKCIPCVSKMCGAERLSWLKTEFSTFSLDCSCGCMIFVYLHSLKL